MITYINGDIFNSECKILVNATNSVGIMGGGLALQFKNTYYDMYLEYKKLCELGQHKIGELHLWKGPNKWVLNFPTKTTWREPSKIEYIEEGLQQFIKSYKELRIDSIAFPALGCGLGKLSWDIVKPLMEHYLMLTDIDVDIEIYEPKIN